MYNVRLNEDVEVWAHRLGQLSPSAWVPPDEIVALLKRADVELDQSRRGFPASLRIANRSPRGLLGDYVLLPACEDLGWARTKALIEKHGLLALYAQQVP